MSRSFAKSIPPDNSFCKTSSVLFRHLPEYLEGRTPKKNVLSFLEEIGRAQKQKAGEHFFCGACERSERWRNDTSVRFSFKPPRTRGVRLVGIGVAFKIHSNFV
jgi:hypothetical protein